MQLTSLNCNYCGATLEVSDATDFVTCGQCFTRQALEPAEILPDAEPLEEQHPTVDPLPARLAKIGVLSQLERLDAEWERERKKFIVTDQYGRENIPARIDCIKGVLLIIVALFVTVESVQQFPQLVPFGILFIAITLMWIRKTIPNANAYRAAYARYLRRKSELGNSLKHGASPSNPPEATDAGTIVGAIPNRT